MSVLRGFTLRRTVQRWHIHSPGGSISSLSGGLLQEKHKAKLNYYLLSFLELFSRTQPESGQLCSSTPRHFLLFMVTLPGFALPYIHLARHLQEASLPWHPSQLHGFRALSDLHNKDKCKIHWCATHIPPPKHHTSLNNLITPCDTTQIPVQHSHTSRHFHPLDLQ